MGSEKLKGCPFCNGPAVNVAGEYVTCGSPTFLDCAGRSVKAEPAAWNTRAPADLRSALEALELADATLRGANMNRNVVERKVVAAIELLRAAPAATPATGKAKWRERWYGSDPQKGSAITDEHGNLIAYFGGDEATHAAVTKAVIAHNSALASLPLTTETGIPHGWALVPVEPTEAMKAAGLKVVLRYDDAVASWSAMLAAAPAPTQGDAS